MNCKMTIITTRTSIMFLPIITIAANRQTQKKLNISTGKIKCHQ